MSQILHTSSNVPENSANNAANQQEAQPSGSDVPRAFAVLFAVVGAFAIAVVLPYWVPIFLAATLAVTLMPMHRFIANRMPKRPTLAAILTTLALFAVVVAPLASLLAYGANEVAQGIAWLQEALQLDNLKALMNGKVPTVIQDAGTRLLGGLHVEPADLQKYLGQAVEVGQKATPQIAGASLGALGGLLLVLLSFFFFVKDGEQLLGLIYDSSPLRRMHTRAICDEFYAVASASLIGMAFTAIGQSVVLTIGFAVAGLPHLFFLAVMVLLGAFVPLLGSMLVWLPVCIGLALTGSTKAAILLWVYSFVSVNIVDALLKPMLLQGRMAMHGGLTFLGMLGGLSVYGPIGFIAGPLTIAFFSVFLQMYRRDYQTKEVA